MRAALGVGRAVREVTMIRFDTADETLVNPATLKTMRPERLPDDWGEETWVATFLDGSSHKFTATPRRVYDLTAQLLPAPPDFAVLTVLEDNTVLSEPVIAFAFRLGAEHAPTPYTTGGKRDLLDATTGLLDPTGQVVTGVYGARPYPDRESFIKAAYEAKEREGSSPPTPRRRRR